MPLNSKPVKKSFPLLLATLLVLGACTDTIPLNRDDTLGLLIVNANMDAQAESHKLYLGQSFVSKLDSIDEGSVKCYVNGELLAEGLGVEDERARWRSQKRYDFDCSFRTGDVVRIEATGTSGTEELSASAEIVVPREAEFKVTDYSFSINKSTKDINLTVSGSDIKGEDNYYRLSVSHDARIYFYTDNPQEGEQESYYCDVEGDAASAYYTVNDNGISYLTFSDSAFKDQDFSVSFSAYNYDWIGDISICLSENTFDRAEIHERYIVKLWTLTQDYFNYLNALDAYDYGYDFYEEPVSVPSNVNNGVGFVSLSNSTTQVVEEMMEIDNFYSESSSAK